MTDNKTPIELHNYPFDSVIKYKESGRSFSYDIVEEGYYPHSTMLQFTNNSNKYKIPDGYIVNTTWGRVDKCQTVQCSINYVENKPIFKVAFGQEFEHNVISRKTPTHVGNLYLKVSKF